MTHKTMRRGILGAVLALAFALPTGAFAAPIIIFGTGLDAAGNPLPLGAADPHYAVVIAGLPPAEVRTGIALTYFPNNALSQWVWQYENGSPTAVTLTFRTTFDLTGFDPTTAVINGAWGTDNWGAAIRLNGNVTGTTLLSGYPGAPPISNFQALHSFTINNPAWFLPGVNTLEFDIIGGGGSQEAFRAQLSGTAAVVPEPGTLTLLGLGLAGLRAWRKRRQ